MKTSLSTLVSFFFIFCNAQQTKSALFLGNSYTASNNLPQLISSIALSFGDTLQYDSNTPGGYTMKQHAQSSGSIAKIFSNQWDYVVMQSQSQEPSFPPSQVAQDVLPYASDLADTIRVNNSCSIPMFFMTWGRKNGDAFNCQFYPPVCTYEGMQKRLRESYILMGQQNNAEVSPVGAVWKEVRNQDSTLELYSPDESHPSLAGSYVSACTFYASIFHKSPVGGYFPPNLDSLEALLIQNVSHNIVFDSLNTWMIDTLEPAASYVWQISSVFPECRFKFDGTGSENADSLYWDFDDGSYGSGDTISHIYTSGGNYWVTLEAWRGCLVDTITQFVNAYPCFGSVDELSQYFTFYPNPAKSILKIDRMDNLFNLNSYKIFDLNGKLILSGSLNSNIIKLAGLSPSVYILELEGEKTFRVPFEIVN